MTFTKPNKRRCDFGSFLSQAARSPVLCSIIALLLAPLTVEATHASETSLASDAVSEIGPAADSTENRSSDSPLLNAITDNLRFTLDFSSRATDFGALGETGYTHAVGIDSYKVISSATRDIGTLILQAYVTRIDNMIKRPGFFDGKDDTELVYRIFN